MHAARFANALAAVLLVNGLLYLTLDADGFAADRLADARKYTQDLKTSKDPKVRVTALLELGKLAQVMKGLAADALPHVYKALDDKDPAVRAAAATCLGQCDEPADKAVPLLVKMLKEEKEDSAKVGAIRGLAAMGPAAKGALGELRTVVKNADKKSAVGNAAKAAIKAIAVKDK